MEIIPETRRRPDERVFKATTLLPRNLPAKRIKTDPGWTLERTFGGFLTGVGPFLKTASSAG